MQPAEPHLSDCLCSALLKELCPGTYIIHETFNTCCSLRPNRFYLTTTRSATYRTVGLFRAHLSLLLLTYAQIMTKNPPGFLASSSATTANRTLPSGGIVMGTTTSPQTPSRGINTNCTNTTGEGNVNCNNTTGNGNKNCTNVKNCYNCTNCTDCADCNDCKNTTNSRGCKECTNCSNCTDCIRCLNCSNISGVTGGKNQRG